MAEVITKEQLENASVDAKDLGECVHGNESGMVTPRIGDPYPTLPAAIQKIIETGGFEPFLTEVALLASTPTVSPKAAKALDTKKIWYWDGSWHDSGLSELDQANAHTNSSVANSKVNTLSIVDLKIEGGNLNLISGLPFIYDGFVNTEGGFIGSAAGYKTTDFIPVEANQTIKCSLNASSTVSALAFYDANKNYLSSLVGNSSNTERSKTTPVNTVYVRVSNFPTNQPSPTCYVAYQRAALNEDDLTIKASLNIANPALIVNDSYVNSSGTVTNGAGWKYIKIPVEAGKTYTFGRFLIDSSGYYAFHTAENTNIAGSNGAFQNNSLPRTVIAPASATYLLIDIARPTNTATQYAQLTVNEGTSLIAYVSPIGTVSEIKGYKLSGSGGGSDPTPIPENIVVQGGNATLADIIADSVTTGALIANLPTSSAGLEVGQAYIDNGTVKVVMA